MTSLWSESMLVLFAILVLGYLAGTVSVRGISLGTSGVLFVALVCGYFGAQVPKEVMDLGLTLYVYCVGIQAGPMFFRTFRRSGWQFSVVAVAVVVAGAAAAVAVSYFMHIPHDIATGLYAGGLTNTPALVGAMEIAERIGWVWHRISLQHDFGRTGHPASAQTAPSRRGRRGSSVDRPTQGAASSP